MEGLGGIARYIFLIRYIFCCCYFLFSSTKKWNINSPLDAAAVVELLLNIIAFNLHIQINETTSPQRIVNNVAVCCVYPVNMLVVVPYMLHNDMHITSIRREFFDSNSSVVYDIFRFAISRAFW